MRYLLFLFIVVPLVELYLLLWLGTIIGFWPTVAIVLVTGTLGAALAKHEGWKVLRGYRESLARGQLPSDDIIEGLLVLVGGVLLVTPGVLTDLTGLLLMLGPTRRWAAERIRQAAAKKIKVVTSGFLAGEGDAWAGPMGSAFGGWASDEQAGSSRWSMDPDGRVVEVVDTEGEVVAEEEPQAKQPPDSHRLLPPGS